MTGDETRELMRELLLVFPNLSDDAERCRDIRRRLEVYPLQVGKRALDEYFRTSDAKWFELPRLLAVVEKIDRARKENEAEGQRVERAREAREAEATLRDSLHRADEQIARMSDEQVMQAWRPLLERLSGKAREWAEEWGPEKVRRNHMLRLHIADQLSAHSE